MTHLREEVVGTNFGDGELFRHVRNDPRDPVSANDLASYLNTQDCAEGDSAVLYDYAHRAERHWNEGNQYLAVGEIANICHRLMDMDVKLDDSDGLDNYCQNILRDMRGGHQH